MVKRKSKKRKGGNTKTPKNTKQLVIKNTLDNFPKFKVFLKQLSNKHLILLMLKMKILPKQP